jgi:uncharacterized protein (TIGR00106 family)
MKAMVAVSITPLGTGKTGLSEYIASAIRVLERYPDIQHDTNSMFTIMSGDKERIFQAIIEMQEAVFKKGAKRVSTLIKIDERRDKEVTPEDKIKSLKKHLGG